MKALWVTASLLGVCLCTVSIADDGPAPSAVDAAAVARVTSAVQTAPHIQQVPAASSAATDGTAPAQFTTEAHWDTAGYNNTEIVYTIQIQSQDTRILHCSTELHGFYLENGKKVSISDRQNSSIFPGQQGKAGNWLGMDPDSGATYTVNCKPR